MGGGGVEALGGSDGADGQTVTHRGEGVVTVMVVVVAAAVVVVVVASR